MVPRLSQGALDRQNWQSFIKGIQERYKDDKLVEFKPNYIEFKIGEHPLLPLEGYKFLRFSSKVSGHQGNEAMEYIKTVTRVAKLNFGSRVQFWHECADNYGHYDWKDVNESLKRYQQVRESSFYAWKFSNAV